MQAVGRIGSYISKSVYTVSGPFHPFGGAVDIIVVQQPDGSYKSSPWYVRFGKFQGVLKSKEKVVSISVNDVDADFHMHLDHKGEAFFLREVDVEESECVCSPPSSSGEDMEGQSRNRLPLKAKSCNYDSDWPESVQNERNAMTRANSRRSQFLGFVFGRRSSPEEEVMEKNDAPGFNRRESLELAEFTADLLDLKWSTNLDSPRTKQEKASLLPVADTSENGVTKELLVDGSNHDDTIHVSKENGYETKCVTSEYIVKTTTSVESVREDTSLSNSDSVMTDTSKSDYHVSSVSIVSEVVKSDSEIQNSIDKLNGLLEIQECLSKEDQFRFIHEEKMSLSEGPMGGASESIVTECFSQLVCLHQSNDPLKDIGPQNIPAASGLSISTCLPLDENNVLGLKQKHESSTEPVLDPQSCDSIPPCLQALRIAEEELDSTYAKQTESNLSDHVGKEAEGVYLSGYSLDQSVIDDYLNDAGLQTRRLCSVSSDACINETGQVHSRKLTRTTRSLPIIEPFSNNLETTNPSMCPGMNSGTYKDHQSPGARIIRKSEEEFASPSIGSPTSMDSLEGSRRNWSFPSKRSSGRKVPDVDMNGCENSNGVEIQDNFSDLERGPDVTKVKTTKKNIRTITPTSEQLASLNLKEGKNIVVFTFSTSMLGNQQVDAQIFLWRWDTKIVISDVDGTITRSDLLGQVMPLVGMDWLQTGVAHLFSAIKENGYQLLFLSARSISQSFITRQFLFNIKQDGKALPDGPVVISPDGLFPSLFREVVRRAPHEFKIACLEDIKALFPPDRNPFYAGFGNRDTDEVSYLKVGIPMGKIFIINPKGEIAVNRRVDTKSYLALHALVHGMFPTISTCEEEDFNSWNYWKIPPTVMEP